MLPTADWVELITLGLLLFLVGFFYHALAAADDNFRTVAVELESLSERLAALEQKVKAYHANG